MVNREAAQDHLAYATTDRNMSATPSGLRLEAAIRSSDGDYSQARQFWTVARALAANESFRAASEDIQRKHGTGLPERFAKDIVTAASTDVAWGNPSGRDLAAAFLASVRAGSVIDSILRFGKKLPQNVPYLVLATGEGETAGEVNEGALKAVRRITPDRVEAEQRKVAAIAVYTQELARATENEAARVIEAEMTASVLRGMNRSILGVLPKTSIASTGTAVGDMQAGIAAAGPSTGYVVAATAPLVQELAFAADGRMSINGGDFLPGVAVIPVEAGASDAPMTVIPASRVAMVDYGLTVRNAQHATVFMTDDPEEPITAANLVSLWQTDSKAVLVERIYRLIAAAESVEVG